MSAPVPAPEQGDAGDDVIAAWEEALEVLEQDARSAVALAKDPQDAGPVLSAWTPPTPGGPVPEVLVDRVRELLRLQAAVREDLARAMGDTQDEIAGLHRTPVSARPGAASYVDVSA